MFYYKISVTKDFNDFKDLGFKRIRYISIIGLKMDKTVELINVRAYTNQHSMHSTDQYKRGCGILFGSFFLWNFFLLTDVKQKGIVKG